LHSLLVFSCPSFFRLRSVPAEKMLCMSVLADGQSLTRSPYILMSVRAAYLRHSQGLYGCFPVSMFTIVDPLKPSPRSPLPID
jgi:hypothetical protein